jgi:hypothetical protein
VKIKAGQTVEVLLTSKPMIDMAAKGWYSGSTHAHANKGANQHNSLQDVMSIARAEGLHLITTLAGNKDTRIIDREHFVPGGGEHPVSRDDPSLIILVGQEYRPLVWGHVFLVGLRDHLISPFTAGYEGIALESLYPTNTDVFRMAKAQGGVTG